MVAKMTMTTEGMQLAIPPASTSVIDARILGQIPFGLVSLLRRRRAVVRSHAKLAATQSSRRSRVAFNPSAA